MLRYDWTYIDERACSGTHTPISLSAPTSPRSRSTKGCTMSTPWKGKHSLFDSACSASDWRPADSGLQWKQRPSPRATSLTCSPPRSLAQASAREVPKVLSRTTTSSDGTAKRVSWVILGNMSIRTACFYDLISYFAVSKRTAYTVQRNAI